MATLGTHSNTELYQHLERHTLHLIVPLLTSDSQANWLIQQNVKKHQETSISTFLFILTLATNLKVHRVISKATGSPSFPS